MNTSYIDDESTLKGKLYHLGYTEGGQYYLRTSYRLRCHACHEGCNTDCVCNSPNCGCNSVCSCKSQCSCDDQEPPPET